MDGITTPVRWKACAQRDTVPHLLETFDHLAVVVGRERVRWCQFKHGNVGLGELYCAQLLEPQVMCAKCIVGDRPIEQSHSRTRATVGRPVEQLTVHQFRRHVATLDCIVHGFGVGEIGHRITGNVAHTTEVVMVVLTHNLHVHVEMQTMLNCLCRRQMQRLRKPKRKQECRRPCLT